MQRRGLAVLFLVLAFALGLVALWAALEGGRAWVIAVAACVLAVWMGSLAKRTAR